MSELKEYLRQVVLDNCSKIIVAYYPLDFVDFSNSVEDSKASSDDITDIVTVLEHAIRDQARDLKAHGESDADAENSAVLEILKNPLFRLMIDSSCIEAILDCDYFEDYYSDDDNEDEDGSEMLMA